MFSFFAAVSFFCNKEFSIVRCFLLQCAFSRKFLPKGSCFRASTHLEKLTCCSKLLSTESFFLQIFFAFCSKLLLCLIFSCFSFSCMLCFENQLTRCDVLSMSKLQRSLFKKRETKSCRHCSFNLKELMFKVHQSHAEGTKN